MFLDTNVLVSAFATRGLCEVVLEEVERVLRLRFRMPRDRVEEVLAFLGGHEVVPRPAQPTASLTA